MLLYYKFHHCCDIFLCFWKYLRLKWSVLKKYATKMDNLDDVWANLETHEFLVFSLTQEKKQNLIWLDEKFARWKIDAKVSKVVHRLVARGLTSHISPHLPETKSEWTLRIVTVWDGGNSHFYRGWNALCSMRRSSFSALLSDIPLFRGGEAKK